MRIIKFYHFDIKTHYIIMYLDKILTQTRTYLPLERVLEEDENFMVSLRARFIHIL